MTTNDGRSPTKAPEGDDFYKPDSTLLGGEHGEVIWSRELPTSSEAALQHAGSNTLVLYRSRDVHGKPIAVSGIIAMPPGTPPKGGFPMVSWAHGTVGCANFCAPSRDIKDSPAHIYNKHPQGMLNAFLDQRWAVLMTDYEGLGTSGLHPYLLGESEAHGVLDIALAARQLFPQLSDKMAIVGHSQGGQGALFAAHHAPTWTPDLDLRGVAALAPAAGMHLLVEAGTRYDGPLEGFAFTALFLAGALAANPNIDVNELLTENALKVWPHIHTRARIGLSDEDSWGGLKGTDQLRPEENRSKRLFFDQLKLTNPALRIVAPIRISQAEKDTRINVNATRVLLNQLGAINEPSSITYREYDEVEPTNEPKKLGAHFGLMETDLASLTAWLKVRLDELR